MNCSKANPRPEGASSRKGSGPAESDAVSALAGHVASDRPEQLVVVVPTYNESSNLEELVDVLFALPIPGLRLVIVDDNSPDGTGVLADELARRYNQAQTRMTVIHRSGKGGLGAAYVTGFRRALSDGADFVVQMDADFSHNPASIVQMLGLIRATRIDVVIGSRYVPGGTLDERWSLWRNLLSWWANVYCRSILRIRVRDLTAGFKLWRRSALQEIRLDTIRSNGYIFQVEMAYLSEKLGFHIIEMPIHFEDRRVGQSKMGTWVKIEAIWRVWELLWRHRKRRSGKGGPRANSRLFKGDGRSTARR